MNKIKLIIAVILMVISFNGMAQEKYGNTLNLGLGLGYYGYGGVTFPVLHANYEIDILKDFTLAPFLTYYSYSGGYSWGDNSHAWKNYSYHETVVPFGLKGTYYFDDLIGASPKWDFYLAGSLGILMTSHGSINDNVPTDDFYRQTGSLFFDLHIGTEYHISSRIGVFLDLSTGVSTIGIAIH